MVNLPETNSVSLGELSTQLSDFLSAAQQQQQQQQVQQHQEQEFVNNNVHLLGPPPPHLDPSSIGLNTDPATVLTKSLLLPVSIHPSENGQNYDNNKHHIRSVLSPEHGPLPTSPPPRQTTATPISDPEHFSSPTPHQSSTCDVPETAQASCISPRTSDSVTSTSVAAVVTSHSPIDIVNVAAQEIKRTVESPKVSRCKKSSLSNGFCVHSRSQLYANIEQPCLFLKNATE